MLSLCNDASNLKSVNNFLSCMHVILGLRHTMKFIYYKLKWMKLLEDTLYIFIFGQKWNQSL